MAVRRVRNSWKSQPTVEGAGVHLNRVFGFHEVPRLDPFLLLDDFRSNRPDFYIKGFPWHPHRGIETITYVLQGEVEHGDSLGNRGIIGSGDVQWMTAGRGIIHQEMPRGGQDKVLAGFQLWANLPAAQKMMGPRYREVGRDQIPGIETGTGANVKIIAGNVSDTEGAIRGVVTEPAYLDVSIPAGGTFAHRVPPGHTVFAYVIEGEGQFDDSEDGPAFGNGNIAVYGDGDEVRVRPVRGGAVRFLLASGKPIGEPVAWYGPIVMNTDEELKTAMAEFRNGTFVRKD
jgi:quercetin 2,3-dioxygenase